MESKTDSLNEMFLLREEFMNALVQHRGIYPKWPLNVSDKENQKIINLTERQKFLILIVKLLLKRMLTHSITSLRLLFL